jgi:hypothetical protein
MALGTIANVGPRSPFTRHKHTRKHIRDFDWSRLLGETGPDGAEHNPSSRTGRIQTAQRAPSSPALAAGVLSELDRILAAAEGEAERTGRATEMVNSQAIFKGVKQLSRG